MARSPQVWFSGPWKRVNDTPTAFGNAPDELVSATNIYLQDTTNGSGVFARWGYQVSNLGDPLAGIGQCVHSHIDASGTYYNFIVADGHIYRSVANGVFGTYTDVTPVDVIMTGGPIFMLSFNGHLIINGGGGAPWIATDLSSTPITLTAIDIDGAGTAWQAKGQPVEYAGSVIFLRNNTDIVWSVPGDPATGYLQDPYDFSWTLLAAGSEPLGALWATNLALYYFRDHSIGALTGTPATAGSTSGSDFRNSSTQDAISAEVGCNASQTIKQYGNNIFFLDTEGRPWLLPISGGVQVAGSILVPIWQQMQSVLTEQFALLGGQGGLPTLTALNASASLFPVLNLYLVGNFTVLDATPAITLPNSLAAFDARTGAYEGQWFIGDNYYVAAQGILYDSVQHEPKHVMIGSITTSSDTADAKYIWAITRAGVWYDSDDQDTPLLTPPNVSVTTPRFGFDANRVQNVDKVTAITGTSAKVSMTVSTPQDTVTVAPTPLPASTDGTFRAVAGAQVFGRGLTVAISPDYDGGVPSNQWSLQQIVAQGVSSLAGPDDV